MKSSLFVDGGFVVIYLTHPIKYKATVQFISRCLMQNTAAAVAAAVPEQKHDAHTPIITENGQ